MKEKIKSYIFEIILNKEISIYDETSLYSSGLLNSMAHLKLINFIERTFKISIPLNELRLENFDTVNQISCFIENKTACSC